MTSDRKSCFLDKFQFNKPRAPKKEEKNEIIQNSEYENMDNLHGVNMSVRDDFLFFNRIQKTGSENFVYLLEELSKRNNFSHQRLWSSHTLRAIEFQAGTDCVHF